MCVHRSVLISSIVAEAAMPSSSNMSLHSFNLVMHTKAALIHLSDSAVPAAFQHQSAHMHAADPFKVANQMGTVCK